LRKKPIKQLKARFSALFLTWVYAKKKIIVIRAPMTMVYFLPSRVEHIHPANIGPGIEQTLAMA